MTNYDNLPKDFTIDQLADPTPETLVIFQSLCTQLDSISDVIGSLKNDESGNVSGKNVTYFLMKTFQNGSVIDSMSTHGTDEWLKIYSESMPIRSINLRTCEGIVYQYTEEIPGKLRLWIKKPGERVAREETPIQFMEVESGNGISLTIQGTPDVIRALTASIAEKKEVRKQGLDILTEGNLKEFTDVIQAALSSGAVDTEFLPEVKPTSY